MISEKTFIQHLRDGAPLPVYFLFGEEPYLTEHYARRLTGLFSGELEAFNVQALDGREADVAAIEDAAESLPLLADRKCVSVRDLDVAALPAEEHKRLLALLTDPPASCVLLFWQCTVEADVKKSAKWRAFLAAVEKHGAAVDCPRRTGAALTNWLTEAAARRGATLPRDAAQRLTERCGDDMALLASELDKLAACTQASIKDAGTRTADSTGDSATGGGNGLGTADANADGAATAAAPVPPPAITPAMVDALTTRQLDASVFDLSKAVLSRRYDTAFFLLDDLLAQREEPVAILAVLSGTFIDMYRMKVAQLSGIPADKVAAALGYRGREFRLRYAAADARRLSLSSLRACLDVLARADKALKSSRADDRLLLERALAALMEQAHE